MTNPSYKWVAHLEDGSRVWQDKGAYSNLPRDRVIGFDLWHGDRLAVRLDMNPDWYGRKALIYRKRTLQDNHGNKLSFHVLGWQRDIGGQIAHNLVYVFEHDGSVLLGREPDNLDFQDPIEPFPWENDLKRIELVEN